MLLILSLVAFATQAAGPDVSYGIRVMVGIRYDNLRMCVATPAGKKGGPIADIMLDTRFRLKDDLNLTINLPVMRPILFGIAFKMLQFEPGITLEKTRRLNDRRAIIAGPGLGISFHYGPDYESDKKSRGESFFAIGPYLSALCAFRGSTESGKTRGVGLRAFYVPLFSQGQRPGTVAGCAIEGEFGN